VSAAESGQNCRVGDTFRDTAGYSPASNRPSASKLGRTRGYATYHDEVDAVASEHAQEVRLILGELI
jgi:hypothetical protein